MKIIKRNGGVVDFDLDKIENAIGGALGETKETIEWTKYEGVLRDIVETCQAADDLSVEMVQDIVEVHLMKAGLYDTAKAYILYRQKREKKRKEGWEMNDLQRDILKQKYEFENEGFHGFLDRVSGGNSKIRKLIQDRKFLFGGRILASRGLHKLGYKITYSNCYVLPAPEDNIESIFDTAKVLARTFSYGGGAGVDVGKLRPRGTKINNAAKETTGAVSFMDLYSLTTGLISQKGRRGALMITIPCSHPDLEEFITIKADLTKITSANISIRIDDEFMRAVVERKPYTCHFTVESTGQVIEKVVDANKLFTKMAAANHEQGEPGAAFWDKISSWHLMSADPEFSYAGLNPCGEEPLPEMGACLLGSLNLSEYVKNPFTNQAYFDYETFAEDAKTATIALNEVLDEGAPLHPLKEQGEAALKWRQIGLGIMGYADALIKMGITYGTKESIEVAHKMGSTLINSALQQSALLAKEQGVFPAYNADYIFQSDFLHAVATEETKELIQQYGLRNSQLLTSAPTGTLSTLLGVSGGLEPIYKISYTRKTETLNSGEDSYYKIFTPIAEEYMERMKLTDEEQLPNFFITSQEIPWKRRVEIQGAWQHYIDAAISSTVNLPQSTKVEEIKELYIYAWEKGLKGITIFRDGCKRAGILSSSAPTKNQEKNIENLSIEALQDLISQKAAQAISNNPNVCPMCSGTLKHEGGCSECLDCGYSPCSV